MKNIKIEDPLCPFLSVLVLVLLSASVERFSVSRMQDFLLGLKITLIASTLFHMDLYLRLYFQFSFLFRLLLFASIAGHVMVEWTGKYSDHLLANRTIY